MRLLIATDQWAPDVVGGSARVAADTARGLAQLGHHVVVLAPARDGAPRHERDTGVELHRDIRRGPLPETLTNIVETWRSARRRRSFDVLVAHQVTGAAGLRAARIDAPLALVFHASPSLEHRYLRSSLSGGERAANLALDPVLRWLERAAVARADLILVLSEYSRRLLLSAHPGADGRIVRVSGGVDVRAFTPRPRDTARRRFGIEDDTALLISVRRLEPRMGLEELLLAAALLRDRGLAFLLVVAGGGDFGRRLRQLAVDLGLTERVRFAGRIDEPTLRDLYAAADLFVLPTVAYEGFGMATLEALASGVPVVGTAVGATPELLEQLDAGLIARSAHPEEIAEAIEATLARSDATFRAACAAYARARYDWQRVILDWEQAFARVMGRAS